MNYLPEWESSKRIVIDANLAAANIIPILGLEKARDLFIKWAAAECTLSAREWWLAEVISILRQYVYRKIISPASAREAVDGVFALEVELIRVDNLLCKRALDWADSIHHSKVYDAIYLALAEKLGAEFWSSDKKLANAAHAAGAPWVHWMGETTE